MRILLLEDSYTDAEIVQRILQKENIGCEFKHVMTREEYADALEQYQPELVISDNTLPQFNATEALHMLRERSKHIPFILVTGAVSEEFAAGIIKLGADDYLLKDRLARLPVAVDSAVKQRQTEKENLEAVEQIKRANERYELIGTATSDALWDWNLETGAIWGNAVHQQFYGLTMSDPVPGQEEWLRRIHPEDRERIVQTMARAMASDQKSYSDEYRFYTEHAGWIYVYGRTLIKRNLVGRAIRLVGSMMDVTEIRNAEASIRKSEEKYRLLFERNLAGVCETNIDGVILSSNNAFAQMLGFESHTNIEGENIIQFYYSASDRERFLQIITKDKQLTNQETTLKHRDGRKIHTIENLSMYTDIETGEQIIEGIIIDVSNLKKAETDILVLQQKMLHQKVQEQKKITRAVIKAQEKERNYLGLELHDNVCQILVGAKLHLGIVAVHDEKVKGMMGYPLELLNSSIEEIRMLSHQLVTPVKDVDLEDMIKSLLSNFGRDSGIKTSFSYQISKKRLSDDLKLNIYRIIQEQTNNIIKHAAASEVGITIGETGRHICIVVTDNGKGFKLTKKRTGIGISNMMNRIESYNGKMQIKTSPGKGCVLSLKIPLVA